MVEGVPPGLVAGEYFTRVQASNRGLYFLIENDPRPHFRILKLEGDPSSSDNWKFVSPENNNYNILDYAIANPYSEAPGAIDFYYIASTSSERIWGRYSLAAGGVVTRATQTDANGPRPMAVVAGNPVGAAAQKSWILDRTTSGRAIIRQDDGVYSGDGTISDRFSIAATPQRPYFKMAFAHPTESLLYVVSGGSLSVYDPTMQLANYSFEWAFENPEVMIFYNSDLYVSYNTNVWKLSPDGAWSKFASKEYYENFCITGGEIYLAKGEAINIQTKARRNWISRGTLTPAQTAQAEAIRGGSPWNVHCSANASGPPVLYSQLPGTRQIRMITPLTD